MNKIFSESREQEAIKAIYASLQLQYGHCEERLHSLYGDSEPVIGDPKTISRHILEDREKEDKIDEYTMHVEKVFGKCKLHKRKRK